MDDRYKHWFTPLSSGTRTLSDCYRELKAIGLEQKDIPFLIQLVENPKFDLPGFDIFHGATDLKTHDYIHIILGRGLMAKDEAFVIGFTMGSTNRVHTTEEWLYGLFAKHLYPEMYRFNEEDLLVYRDAVKLGFISDCQPLAFFDYESMLEKTLHEIRAAMGLEEDLLRAYYAIEQRRYPNSPESQRLL